ncbi:AbiTii domain-containing protein [Arundinibacter roseus]|uniref:AbiTii domain-containing protein n=1 Tax=Arundinibacter roseus TaxID=2070510 RepID=A0A4R4KFU4_9BACT|nr:hypothetical protein [Arundinibacter roseus]TDB66798.1 hypothetical protein EZE20_06645 [Arundinibacter roseus]
MTIIEQIIDELSNSEKSLTNPLLKTKVLATRISNEELMKWTNDELSGYKEKELPTYRLGTSNITCTMQQGFDTYENVPLPLMVFQNTFIDDLLQFRFNDSIQTLENQERENRNGIIYKDFGPDMCAILTKMAIDAGQRFAITTMSMVVHVSQITQVLAEVRAKLLDFMLQLEKEVPNLDELIKNKLIVKENVNEKIGKIYNQTIINTSGFGNTITTGEGNSVTSNINITLGSVADLKRELEKNSVPAKNIDEIIQIVQEEEPNRETKKFGTKANKWVQKMVSMTLDGTWQIGTGAAGGLLVELLKAYYGIH